MSGRDPGRTLSADPPQQPAPVRTTGARGSQGPHRTLRATLRESLVVLVVALVLASLLRAFVVQAFVIPSGSMENTLLIGDRIVVDKLPDQHVRRGEVVVFTDPGNWLGDELTTARGGPLGGLLKALQFVGVVPNDATGHLVKRVIGLPGDRVSCTPGAGVVVNGRQLAETGYLFPGARPCAQPFRVTVTAGRLFVLGDNRDNSGDSRLHGLVPESDVTGRAFAVVYPFDRFTRLRIPSTFAAVPAPR